MKVGAEYIKVERLKKNGINERQPGRKVSGEYVYEEMRVRVTSMKDCGDYWYLGYKPIGKDAGRCGFGYTRYYKDIVPEYGTVAMLGGE